MLYKSRAIVLHSIRYGDTSLIVHLLTEKYGRQVFMVKGARSKKTSFKANLFFPLNLLQIEAYYRPHASLQRLKEVSPQPLYITIYDDPIKSTVVQFLAETLYRTIQMEHFNPEFFEFIYNALQLYDKMDKSYHNFHLVFLIQLLKYEGFSPTLNFSEENRIFSLHAGRFLPTSHAHPDDDMDEASSLKFFRLLQSNFTNMSEISLSSNERMYLLNKIIHYLQIHLHEFAPIKSLSVLHEVFKF